MKSNRPKGIIGYKPANSYERTLRKMRKAGIRPVQPENEPAPQQPTKPAPLISHADRRP